MHETLTIWHGIRIEVPSSWEILQYSRKPDVGYLAWADRYQYRLELNWKSVPGLPDFEHMMNDYREKLEEDGVSGLTLRRSHGWHGLIDPNPGGTVRYGKYVPEQKRLLEILFMWPEKQDRALEDRVLASVGPEAEDGEQSMRWRAFGLDAAVPAGLSLDTCNVMPANAAWTFGDGEKFKESWHVERLGMTDQWLTGGVREWLDGKDPTDLVDPNHDEVTVAGHQVCWTAGHVAALRFPKVGKRVNRYEAAAWVCPVDGRMYHVSRIAKASLKQPKSLVGGTLRCCEHCPSLSPTLATKKEETE
jgi:hypothetical protein